VIGSSVFLNREPAFITPSAEKTYRSRSNPRWIPSCRTLLGAVGTGAVVSLAGCLNSKERVDAYIQLKSITGVLEEGTQREEINIIDVDASYDPNGEQPGLVNRNDDWADQFPVPRMPVVSEGLHKQLTRRFDTVRYVVGTTSPEWAENSESLGSFNVATTRANFNRVQVHSRVTASSDGSYLTIHSVDGIWEFRSDE
jgi:hypothetical protein